jgi:hypothetical protein
LFSLDAGTGIHEFGNNTYPQRVRRRSNLGHIFQGKKCVLWARKYGKCRLIKEPVVWVKNLDFYLKVEIHCVVSVEKVSEPYIHNLSR